MLSPPVSLQHLLDLQDCQVAIYAEDDHIDAWLCKASALHALGRHAEVTAHLTLRHVCVCGCMWSLHSCLAALLTFSQHGIIPNQTFSMQTQHPGSEGHG